MRHLVSGRKFSRTPAHRRAMYRNMASNLFRYERIETTQAKAKELRKITENIITLGKEGSMHSMRLARTFIEDRELLKKVFGDLKERFGNRKGGYTRILKLSHRLGDAAPMVLIELIPDGKAKPKKEDTKAKKKMDKATPKVKATAKPEKEGKPAKPKKEIKEETTEPGVEKK